MRIAPASLVLGVSLASLACATSVDDTTATFVDAGHHGGDTGASVDDVGGGNDTAGAATDSGRSDVGTSLDTGSGGADTATGFDSGSFPLDTGAAGFDTGGGFPDLGTPDTTPPPPTDGSTPTCTTDTDCTFPYNCCQVLAGACGIYIGPLCFPLS